MFGEKPQRLECTANPALPQEVQKTQCFVDNARIDLAAGRLAVDAQERKGLMLKAQADKMRQSIKDARDALDTIQEAIDAKEFAEAISKAQLEEAGIRLLERELAKELARQEGK